MRLIDSCRILSSSSDSLDETLVDHGHKKLTNLKKEFVDDNINLYNIIEIEKILSKDENKKVIEKLKKIYSDIIEKLEKALNNYIGENDFKILKTEFPDKWKYLTKILGYPFEHF